MSNYNNNHNGGKVASLLSNGVGTPAPKDTSTSSQTPSRKPASSPHKSYGEITPRGRSKTSIFMPSRKQASSSPYPPPCTRRSSRALEEAMEVRRSASPTRTSRRSLRRDLLNGDLPIPRNSLNPPRLPPSRQPLRSSSYTEEEITSPATNRRLNRTFNPVVDRPRTRMLEFEEMELVQVSSGSTPVGIRKWLAGDVEGLGDFVARN